MKTWIILQLAVDIILFFIIIAYIIRGGKKGGKNDIATADNISKMIESLNEILSESENISFKLADRISQGKYLLESMDERIKKVDKLIQKVEASEYSSDERYKLISKLAEEGLSTEEIVNKSGISYGEVELIVNLSGRGGREREKGTGIN